MIVVPRILNRKKTYFVFLSLFILTAARQIQIKNLKEEKQEKLLHSSPISRPLKRSRRGAWFNTAKLVKSLEDAAKAAAKVSCTDSHVSCAYWANLDYCTNRDVAYILAYMTENCRQTCNICTK